jgi:hypothetical protein
MLAPILQLPADHPSSFERFVDSAATQMIHRREFTARFPNLCLRLDLETLDGVEPELGIPCAIFLITAEIRGRIVKARRFISADTVNLARVSPQAAIAELYS